LIVSCPVPPTRPYPNLLLFPPSPVSMFSTYILIFIYKYIIYILKTKRKRTPPSTSAFAEVDEGKSLGGEACGGCISFHMLLPQGPQDPRTPGPNDPTTQRPNDPTTQRPNDPTIFLDSATRYCFFLKEKIENNLFFFGYFLDSATRYCFFLAACACATHPKIGVLVFRQCKAKIIGVLVFRQCKAK